MSLITVAMLEAELKVKFDQDDAAWLRDQKIPMVQGELETILRRSVEPITVVGEKHLLPRWQSEMIVPLFNTPILDVNQIRVEGRIQDPDGYVVWPHGVEFVVLEGLIVPTSLEFDYDAGFLVGENEAHLTCQSVMITRLTRDIGQRARRITQREQGMTGLTEVSVEGTTMRWGDEFATARQGQILGYLEEEIKMVSRWRRRVIR